MNRGNIPGFYFDEEKQKYFQITAHHAAPANAKYSAANVKREENEKHAAKKRKVQNLAFRKQTVTQAGALKSALLRTTLQRELGHRSYSHLRLCRDDAVANGLSHDHVVPRIKGYTTCPNVTDSHYAAERSCMLFAATHAGGATTCVYAYDWEDGKNGLQVLEDQRPLIALPGRFMSMQHTSSSLLLVSNTSAAIQYYLGPSDPAERGENTLFPTANLQNVGAVPNACAFNQDSQNLVFAGTGLLVVNNVAPGHVGRWSFDKTRESFAVTWLRPTVLAFGLQTEDENRLITHTVCLWDMRLGGRPSSDNSSIRVQRRHRVTGVEKLGVHDHNLLVTSNREISLYDLRMPSSGSSPPLLTIPHTSAGSRLDFTVQGELLAAVDDCYKVQVYSLQSARHLKTLRRDSPVGGYASPLQQLRWQEDRRGSPYLAACADGIVHRWGWQP